METHKKNSLERGMYNYVQPLSSMLTSSANSWGNTPNVSVNTHKSTLERLYNRIQSGIVDVHSITKEHNINEKVISKFIEKKIGKDYESKFLQHFGVIKSYIVSNRLNCTTDFSYQNNIKSAWESVMKDFLLNKRVEADGREVKNCLSIFLDTNLDNLNSRLFKLGKLIEKVESYKQTDFPQDNQSIRSVIRRISSNFDDWYILGYDKYCNDLQPESEYTREETFNNTKLTSSGIRKLLKFYKSQSDLPDNSIGFYKNDFVDFLKSLSSEDLNSIITLHLSDALSIHSNGAVQNGMFSEPLFRRVEVRMSDKNNPEYHFYLYKIYMHKEGNFIRKFDNARNVVTEYLRDCSHELFKFINFTIKNNDYNLDLVEDMDNLISCYFDNYVYDYEFTITRFFNPLFSRVSMNMAYRNINMSYTVNRQQLLNENFGLTDSRYKSLENPILKLKDSDEEISFKLTKYLDVMINTIKTELLLPKEFVTKNETLNSVYRLLFLNYNSESHSNFINRRNVDMYDNVNKSTLKILEDNLLVDVDFPYLIEMDMNNDNIFELPKRLQKYDKIYHKSVQGRLGFNNFFNTASIKDLNENVYMITNQSNRISNFCTIPRKEVENINKLKLEVMKDSCQEFCTQDNIVGDWFRLNYRHGEPKIQPLSFSVRKYFARHIRLEELYEYVRSEGTTSTKDGRSTKIYTAKLKCFVNEINSITKEIYEYPNADKELLDQALRNVSQDRLLDIVGLCFRGYCLTEDYVHDYEDVVRLRHGVVYGWIDSSLGSLGWFSMNANNNYGVLREGYYDTDYVRNQSWLRYPDWVADDDGVYWSCDDYEEEYGDLPERENLHNDGYRYVEGYHHYRRMSEGVVRNTITTVGVEVEKEDKDAYFKESARTINRRTGLMKERDGSLGGWGYEIVTPTFDLYRKDFKSWIEEGGIQYLYDANKSSRCGMHVHIGRVGMSGLNYFDRIKYYVPLLYAIYESRVNHSYSKGKSVQNMIRDRERTQAVNILDNRVEIRCFPSPKSTKTLLWRIELLKIFDKKPLSDVNDLVRDILDNRTRLNKHLKRIYNVKRLTERLSRVVHYIKLFENADWKIEGVVPRKKLREVGFISYQNKVDEKVVDKSVRATIATGNGYDEDNPCAV